MTNLPFFFPTRVVLIDDEPQVLRMTALLFSQLPQVAAVQVFDNAPAALDWLAAEAAEQPGFDAFAAARVHDDHDTLGIGPLRRAVQIDLTQLNAVLNDARRHAMVSVVVCDYAMPGMDGLQFFEKVNSPHVRRVMLTSLCDEQRAVMAFNRGLIHQFVHKADAAGPQGLEAVLRSQLLAFFGSRCGPLAAALALGEDARPLQDPAAARLRDEAMRERQCDTFVTSVSPPGFRLRGRLPQARPARLMLADNARYERAIRSVAEVDGPASLAEALRLRSVLPYAKNGAPIIEVWDEDGPPPAGALSPRVGGDVEPLYWALVDDA